MLEISAAAVYTRGDLIYSYKISIDGGERRTARSRTANHLLTTNVVDGARERSKLHNLSVVLLCTREAASTDNNFKPAGVFGSPNPPVATCCTYSSGHIYHVLL